MLLTSKGKRAPRQLSPERERELITVARTLFIAKGVSPTTMDDIAAKAGVSKATLYRRYKNKQEIFEKIVIDTSQIIANQIGAIELDALNPKESLLNAAARIRKVVLDQSSLHIDVVRLIVASVRTYPDLARKARIMMMEKLYAQLNEFFLYLISHRQMKHEYPQHAVLTFVLLCTGGVRPFFDALESEENELKRLHADLEMFFRGCDIH